MFGLKAKKVKRSLISILELVSFEPLKQLIPVYIFPGGWIRKLQANDRCDEFLTFCCEARVVNEPKVEEPKPEEPKIVEPKIVELKVPTSESRLRQNLWSFYLEGLHRNAVTLKLGDKEFEISHDVLTGQSEVFKNMFALNTTESQSGMVEIKDLSIEAMAIFVKWLYLGDCDKLSDYSNELFIFADKYAFSELKCRCLKYIRDKLTLENVLSRLTMSFVYDEAGLKRDCLNFIGSSQSSNHLPSLLASEEWIKLNNNNSELASKVVSAVFEKK